MKKTFTTIICFSLFVAVAAQNVGIGTNIPNYPLTVISNGSNAGIVQKSGDVEVGFYTNSTAAYLQTWSSHPLHFSTNNGSAVMTINAGNVGIGTTNPVNKLQVEANQSSGSGGVIYCYNSGTVGNAILGVSNAVGTYAVQGSSNNGTAIYGYTNQYRAVAGGTISGTALYGSSSSGYSLEIVGKVKISGGNTNPALGKVLTSDASGNATWEGAVAFRSRGIQPDGAADFSDQVEKKIPFYTEDYDYGNNYNPSTVSPYSTFTAPVKGIYHFDAKTSWGDSGDGNYSEMKLKSTLNGTTRIIVNDLRDFAGTWPQNNISTDVLLEAGEQVFVTLEQHTTDVISLSFGVDYSYFCGRLVVKL